VGEKMIKFVCICGQKIAVPDEQGGKRGKCPKCKIMCPIPKANPPAEPQISIPLSEKTKNTFESSSQTILKPQKDCPYCGEEILASAQECKHCGEIFKDNECTQTVSVHFTCGHCGKGMEAPVTLLGKTVLCEICGCEVEVSEVKQKNSVKKCNHTNILSQQESVPVVNDNAIPATHVSEGDCNDQQQDESLPKALKVLIAVVGISVCLFILLAVVHVKVRKAKHEKQQFAIRVDNKMQELQGRNSARQLRELIDSESDEQEKRILVGVMERISSKAERKEVSEPFPIVEVSIGMIVAGTMLFVGIISHKKERGKAVSILDEDRTGDMPINTESYTPEIMDLVFTALEPQEKLLVLCDVDAVGTNITWTAVLTNYSIKFLGFKRDWLGKNPTLAVNTAIPIHKISTISTSEGKVFLLTFWWEGRQENLQIRMIEVGRALSNKLRHLTSISSQTQSSLHVNTSEGVAKELRKLAELVAEGILSNDEMARAKELLLGSPKDGRDEMVRLLRNLNKLKKEGVITQNEYNMKKWDILSKRNMS